MKSTDLVGFELEKSDVLTIGLVVIALVALIRTSPLSLYVVLPIIVVFLLKLLRDMFPNLQLYSPLKKSK